MAQPAFVIIQQLPGWGNSRLAKAAGTSGRSFTTSCAEAVASVNRKRQAVIIDLSMAAKGDKQSEKFRRIKLGDDGITFEKARIFSRACPLNCPNDNLLPQKSKYLFVAKKNPTPKSMFGGGIFFCAKNGRKSTRLLF